MGSPLGSRPQAGKLLLGALREGLVRIGLGPPELPLKAVTGIVEQFFRVLPVHLGQLATGKQDIPQRRFIALGAPALLLLGLKENTAQSTEASGRCYYFVNT